MPPRPPDCMGTHTFAAGAPPLVEWTAPARCAGQASSVEGPGRASSRSGRTSPRWAAGGCVAPSGLDPLDDGSARVAHEVERRRWGAQEERGGDEVGLVEVPEDPPTATVRVPLAWSARRLRPGGAGRTSSVAA